MVFCFNSPNGLRYVIINIPSIWKLNIKILIDNFVNEEITREIRTSSKPEGYESTINQNLWDVAAVLEKQCYFKLPLLKKKISNQQLGFCHEKNKKEQIKPKHAEEGNNNETEVNESER